MGGWGGGPDGGVVRLQRGQNLVLSMSRVGVLVSFRAFT